MGGRVEWLEGVGKREDAERVGWRAVTFARLLAAGIDVPPGFILTRASYEAFANTEPGEPLPAAVRTAIEEGWSKLGGPAAVRASPLGAPSPSKARRRGGRPEREMYLNLVDASEVCEAVRRFWSRMREASPPSPSAVIVQHFIAADVSAIVHEPPALRGVLSIESAFGGGDLLATGLVLPDKSVVDIPGGRVRSRRLGRKTHQSVPRPEGGVRRRTSPPGVAKQSSLSDESAAKLVALWQKVEDSVGPLIALSVAFEKARPWVTSVRLELEQDG